MRDVVVLVSIVVDNLDTSIQVVGIWWLQHILMRYDDGLLAAAMPTGSRQGRAHDTAGKEKRTRTQGNDERCIIPDTTRVARGASQAWFGNLSDSIVRIAVVLAASLHLGVSAKDNVVIVLVVSSVRDLVHIVPGYIPTYTTHHATPMSEKCTIQPKKKYTTHE